LLKVLFAISLLAWTISAQADVYQWKDAQGGVHFSDTPHVGATKHTLQPLESIKNPLFNMDKKVLQLAYQDVQGSMIVRARINGVAMRFILDTGASLMVISPRMAQKAHINTRHVPHIMLQTANGLVRAPKVMIDSVEMGSWQQQQVQAAVQTVSPQQDIGLMGMSFLKAYRMSIDHQRRMIILEAR